MTNFKINSGYEAVLPKLPKEEFEALKLSIETEGQHYAIIVNEDLEVLDGHHRYRACRELGISPDFEVHKFENKLLEKKFVIESNLRRRNLNDFQKIELGRVLLEVERELAKERLRSQPRAEDGTFQPLPSNEGSGRHEREATAQTAQKLGVSRTTFERGMAIIEKAPEEIKQRIRNGDLSIGGGYKTVSAKTAFSDNRHRCLVLNGQEQSNFGYLNMPDLQTSDPDGKAVILWLFKTDAAEPPEVASLWKGICSPRCIVAKSDKTKCKCKCHGEHHGLGRGVKTESEQVLKSKNAMKRVQRKRTKGFKLQDASPNGLPVVYVGRPSKWGNPYKIGELGLLTVEAVLKAYENWVRQTVSIEDSHFLDPLKGKDLACWCPLEDKNGNPVPCHADVILKILAEPRFALEG